MARSAELLASGLRSCGVDVEVLRPISFFGSIARGTPRKWLSYLDKYLLFPFVLMVRARRCKLVHIVDHSNAVYLFWLRRVKNVVTCNDLLAVRSALGEIPEHRTGFMGRLLQKWILAGLRRADHIICISNATKSDVLRLTKKSEAVVSRIYLGLDSVFETELTGRMKGSRPSKECQLSPTPSTTSAEIANEFNVHGCRYIVHVGGDTWYKNRDRVVSIYREIRRRLGDTAPHLVMVGPPTATQEAGVQFVQNVPNSKLANLYRNAELLVFPSLYEGFGWPVIEANACGCRAIVSSAPSLIEAAGSVTDLIVDSRDIHVWADKVIEVLNEGSTAKERHITDGYRNASRFSRQLMITEYRTLYSSIAPE